MTFGWLSRLLPVTITAAFPGHPIALWMFAPLTLVTLWRSQHHLFAPDGGAQTIAHIPLDAYPPAAAETIVGIFALWGLSQLILALLELLVLVRYRALIPLFYLLTAFEYSMRGLVIPALKTIPTTAAAPGAIANLPMAVAALVLLVLSLWPMASEQQTAESPLRDSRLN